jgi:protein-tyrosine-phosphatase
MTRTIRFNCWGDSGRSPFTAEVANNYLAQKGLDGLYRATSAGVGVSEIQFAARNARQFAMNPENGKTIRDILQVGLARADRKILFAGLDDAAERYLQGSLTELTPGEVGQLVNMVRTVAAYEERQARAATAREFGFRTDLSEHISTQTTPKFGVVIDFAMDKHVLDRLESMWRQAEGSLRPKLIEELGPYATGDPTFSFEDGAYGKLEPNHKSYQRFASKVAPIVRMAIDKACKDGLLPRN